MKQSSIILTSVFLAITLTVGCQTKNGKSSQNNNSGQTINKTVAGHFDTIIGQVVNGDFVLVPNIRSKVSDWENAINAGSSLNVTFSNVFIEINDGNYYLTGVDESAGSTSRIKLVLSSGKFYEAKFKGGTATSPAQGGYSCTCSGCKSTGSNAAKRCSPRENKDGWYCTSCSQGNCVKTVTFSSGGMVSR